MRMELLVLQVIVVLLVVVVNITAESSRWRQRFRSFLQRLLHPGAEEAKSGAVATPWYCQSPVETGVLEVALGFTAAAMALPTFTTPKATTPSFLLWSFDGALLVAAALAAACSLWLFRIYVRQLMLGTSRPENSNPMRAARGNVFSLREAGPYALLAYAMILLLVGLSLLPLIVAL